MTARTSKWMVRALAACAGFLCTAAWLEAQGAGPSSPRDQRPGIPAALRISLLVPRAISHPPDNLPTPAKIELGGQLFADTRLSANGSVSCASCHDPRLGLADGEPRGVGISGERLRRHTPTLWNVAWSRALFWDGRASSLEDQVRSPIEHQDEMGNAMADVAIRLSSIEPYRVAFATAFPAEPSVTPSTIAKALAAYVRTLVSPPTRFDRWLTGERRALTSDEIRGFRLFSGKARCIKCHTGNAFSDFSFHDIGLPSDDPGRGAVIEVPRVNHAFKTPTLRELAWTAPYMHDGSMATIEEVIDHYSGNLVRRPTLSLDLDAKLRLTETEKAELVAFLQTLSSDAPPRPRPLSGITASSSRPAPKASALLRIGQNGKQFRPGAVRSRLGKTLTIVNDDNRTHNVRLDDPRWRFNTGAQEPGDTVDVRLSERGVFTATCGIHPDMQLRIEVE